jgi:hypothetical protein
MFVVADGPTVADWMQGWGIVLSVPLSFIALLLTYGLLRHELRLRRAEDIGAKQAQARLVWAEVVDLAKDPDDGREVVVWRVHNRSSAPVFHPTVFLQDTTARSLRAMNPTLPSVIAPGSVLEGRSDVLSPDWPRNDGRVPEEEFRRSVADSLTANVIFTDNAGSQWTRSGGAAPVRGEPQLSPNDLPRLMAEYLRIPGNLREPRVLRVHARERLENRLRKRIAKRARARHHRAVDGMRADPEDAMS